MLRIAKKALLGFVLSLLLLVFLEGLCSFASFGYDFLTTEPVMTQERAHTQYDELLGWAHVPNLYIGDLYGPGVLLQVNSQGFRDSDEFTPEVPPGKIRVLCSGDSFTLGYGVANDSTWCHGLEELEPRFQTVNMGQGGYGLDQAYLWYMRDGRKLQHQIHLLAFPTVDFGRMQTNQFRGYGKPVLAVENGQLVTRNVPVPKSAYHAPWWTEKLRSLEQLHLIQALRHARSSVQQPEDPDALQQRTQATVSKLFETLRDTHRQQGTVLVLVYLPIRNDHGTDVATEWRDFVRAETQRLDIAYVDLVEVFKKLPRGPIGRMFLRDGHYTDSGNDYFARQLFQRLQRLPQVAPLLTPAAVPTP